MIPTSVTALSVPIYVHQARFSCQRSVFHAIGLLEEIILGLYSERRQDSPTELARSIERGS